MTVTKRVADPPLKFCTERGDLLEKMTAAAKQYAHAASDLVKRIGGSPASDYGRLIGDVEKLRLESKRARELYYSHRAWHGC
jgi:hypothetical protein